MPAFLSLLPILSLLICLLAFKLSAAKASALSFFVTFVIFLYYFRPGADGIAITIAKGCSLALFVILITWGAMFLYNLVNEAKALDVINRNIEIALSNKFHQFILLSWAFAPFLQGIAGFGAPVIVVTSILVSMGFNPVASSCAVLIGHSWAISFGSMGSSIYAIDMVTQSPINEIIVYMSYFGMLAMFFTGLAVCFIYGGIKYVAKGLPFVLFISIVMSIALYILANLGVLSVISLLTGLTGFVAGFFVSRARGKGEERIRLYSAELNLFQAILPYLLTVIFSILFFILDPPFVIGVNFAGYETFFGLVVPQEVGYVKFNILKFPFTIIMISSFISMIVFYKKKTFNMRVAKSVIAKTAQKCVSTTITLLFLLNIAVMMKDSGMIGQIAVSLASIFGKAYPLVAPLIGLLGAFITGSNTNSNIIFGSLQEIAAISIGAGTAVMCAAQSIGASVGASMSPPMVAIGAIAAQIQGNEGQIYRKNIISIFIIIFILGVVNFLILS